MRIEINKELQQPRSISLIVDFNDLSPIIDLLPDLTHITGKMTGMLKLYYVQNDPKIFTNIALQHLSFRLPEYGLKIKPLNLYFSADDHNQRIIINGKGLINDQPQWFNVHGYFEPFSTTFNNLLAINATKIELINTREYHLIGNIELELILLLKELALQVVGDISITKGNINLDAATHSNKIIKSNDIVFINQAKSIHSKTNNTYNLKILPELNCRIEPNTNLIGSGLNAIVSGKLKIYTNQHNTTLLGDGRISIKQGTYNLSNQNFNIQKGRIIYLPGTLINNPILDVKMTPENDDFEIRNKEKYIYIEGTLQNPIIQDKGAINEQQVILQLLNFSDIINAKIKEKLNLQEFSIQEHDDDYIKIKNPTTEDSILNYLNNKHLVIGKKIHNNLLLQYLKHLNSRNQAVKLKYKFKNRFFLEIQTSTEEGYGADLKFCIEK